MLYNRSRQLISRYYQTTLQTPKSWTLLTIHSNLDTVCVFVFMSPLDRPTGIRKIHDTQKQLGLQRLKSTDATLGPQISCPSGPLMTCPVPKRESKKGRKVEEANCRSLP